MLAAIFALFALCAVAFGALGLLEYASRTTETVRTTYPEVTTVQLETGGGDVSIVQGAPGSPVRVAARITRSFTTPERHDRAEGGVLTLASDCGGWLGDCGVDYSVSVPPRTRIVADIGSGEVSIAGVQTRGALVVRGGSGDLELRDVQAPSVDVRVGSGDVEIGSLRSPVVNAELGSGDLEMTLTGALQSVRARAGSGDVSLTVPARESYRIEADAGSGDVSVDEALTRDDRSPRSLSASAGSGDVEVNAGR